MENEVSPAALCVLWCGVQCLPSSSSRWLSQTIVAVVRVCRFNNVGRLRRLSFVWPTTRLILTTHLWGHCCLASIDTIHALGPWSGHTGLSLARAHHPGERERETRKTARPRDARGPTIGSRVHCRFMIRRASEKSLARPPLRRCRSSAGRLDARSARAASNNVCLLKDCHIPLLFLAQYLSRLRFLSTESSVVGVPSLTHHDAPAPPARWRQQHLHLASHRSFVRLLVRLDVCTTKPPHLIQARTHMAPIDKQRPRRRPAC